MLWAWCPLVVLEAGNQALSESSEAYAISGDPANAGQYFGYDGPFPPFNDSLIHHYVFTLYALGVPRVAVEGAFTGPQVREAIFPHVLADATLSGTYTLNRRLI